MLQDNNLMLLDVDGFPRTIDTAADSIGIGVDTSFAQDLAVGGNLTVTGDIISGGTMDVVVSDNFIDLSNGQLNGSNKAGGLTVNVQASAARQAMSTADGAANDVIFSATKTLSFGVGGYDPLAAGIAQGDVIEIAGASDLAGNNGLFIVDSVTATSITIMDTTALAGAARGVQAPWAQTAFENGTETAAGSTMAPGVDLGIFCINDGALLDAGGTAIPTVGAFVSAFAASASLTNIVYEAAANVSLQEAYNVDPVVLLSNTVGDLMIRTNDTGPSADFRLTNEGGTADYLLTSANLLTLGSGDASRLNFSGEITSNILFETGPGTSPKLISNMDQVNPVGGDLFIEGTACYLSAVGNALDATAGIYSNGLNSVPIGYTGGYYTNPSVIGDLTGTVYDGDGNSTAFTISIGIAAGADVAAVLANTTYSPTVISGNPTVILVDGGFGDFTFQAANAAGLQSTFTIDAESVAGVYDGLDAGGSLPLVAGFGAAAVAIESFGLDSGNNPVGDMLLQAYRNLELIAVSTTVAASDAVFISSGGDLSANAAGLATLGGVGGVSINGNADEVDITTSAALDLNFGDMSADGNTIELIGISSVAIDGGGVTIGSNTGSTNIFALGNAPGSQASFSGAGVGSQSVLTANNAYVGGASVGGDLTGTLTDVNGTSSAISVTFPAAAGDLAALIIGAIVPATVTLSDDGFGKLRITSAATGARVSFMITGESAVGIGTSLGFTGGNPTPINPYSASNGTAPVRVFSSAASGDVGVDARRHLDLFSMFGSIELKTQTAGQNIKIEAQSGSLDISGDVSSSVSVGGLNQTLTVEVTGGGASQKLLLGSGGPADDSISLSSATGGVRTAAARASIITTGGAGVKAIDLDSSASATSNIELKSGADGWVGLRSYTWLSTSAGWIAPAIVAVTAGEPLLVMDDAGTSSFTPADAASGLVADAQVIGVATEGVGAGAQCRACTVPGTLVQTALAGAAADVGKPVYLAAAVLGAGKLTLTAPITTGSVVYRVGWCHSVVAGNIKMSFAPQFIALRP